MNFFLVQVCKSYSRPQNFSFLGVWPPKFRSTSFGPPYKPWSRTCMANKLLHYWLDRRHNWLGRGHVWLDRGHKWLHSWCLIITLANMDRFSKFFHQMIRRKILYVYITKIFTLPAVCCYTTLWNLKIENVTAFSHWTWQLICLNKI